MAPAETAATILLVEDDPATRTHLADNLTADGYELLVAGTLREGLVLVETRFPDLAVVDLGLPDGSGLELLRAVRAADGIASRVDPALPVLVLSGRAGELDRVRGFERGCDDYVCKPFSYPELRARIAALLRRRDRRAGGGRLRVGDLELDVPGRTVRLRGAPVVVSQKEFALLRALAAEPTRVFTKEELLRTIWGFRRRGTTRTLDSHACRLRAKLAAHGDRFVVNVWGVGYRLVDGAPAPHELAGAAAVVPLPLVAAGALTPPAVLVVILVLALLAMAERRRRRGLVARALHELRGPLTAAQLALHTVARSGGPSTTTLRGVELELCRAGAALGDLDAACRGRRGRQRDERVDVGALIARQGSAWRAVAPAFGRELDVVAPAPLTAVRGDAVRLAQAVGNLVANALEHGAGRVQLTGRSDGDRVRIEVRDRGPGPLRPGPRPARRPDRGHGLAVAAEVAARHDGRLLSAPTAGGSLVALDLPAWRPGP